MESEVNEVKITVDETRERTETQDNIVAVISDFHNYGLRSTKNASEAMPPSNTTIPNIELPFNTNADLYKSIIFKVGQSYICPECKETFLYLRNVKRHVQRKHPSLLSTLFPSVKSNSSHKCNICKETFFYLMDFKRHVKSKHASLSSTVSPSVEPSASFECDACKGTFSSLRTLKRHVTSMHPSSFSTLNSSVKSSASHRCNICKKNFKNIKSFQSHSCNSQQSYGKKYNCPLCPETLGVKQLNEHFEKSHNLLLKPVKLNFRSYADFCVWKKAIERVTKSFFSKYSSRESNGITYHRFICHRSGTFKTKGTTNKKLKATGSRKINAYCPAAIKVLIEKEGKCEVVFQSQHLGHENEVEYLSLTHEERKYIADKLATNLPLNYILNDIRRSASIMGAERLCQVTRKDLENIKLRLLKNNLFDSSAAKSDEKLTKDLRDIHSRHTESEHIKADIAKIDKGWVITFIERNEIYLIKENSESCDCPLVCVYCRACIKSYICSCSDSSVEGNMCKHIHFFCMERNKIYDVPGCNDSLVCDNNDVTNISNSEQCGYLQTNMLVTKKLLNRDKNKIFVDSEKRSILKNKFSDLIDSLTTEEEYKLSESTIEELAEKLKSMQICSMDTVNNTVIPATYHPVEIVCIDENTQDQHNAASASSHPVEIVYVDKNMQVQHSSIPDTNHSFEIMRDNANTQDEHNSLPAADDLFEMVCVNESTQDQQTSNSQTTTTPKSLIMEMLNPAEHHGAKICYIHFAKAKTK